VAKARRAIGGGGEVSLDLFGDPIDEAKPITGYHEVSARDTTTKGCTDCTHLGKHETVPLSSRRKPETVYTCRLTGAEVEPDFGTCGRWA
jgi:class 3 adenylate cyclase